MITIKTVKYIALVICIIGIVLFMGQFLELSLDIKELMDNIIRIQMLLEAMNICVCPDFLWQSLVVLYIMRERNNELLLGCFTPASAPFR